MDRSSHLQALGPGAGDSEGELEGTRALRATYFSTQFFVHLQKKNGKGYERVMCEGGRRTDIFAEYDTVFIPINHKEKKHWSLATINLMAERLEFYDRCTRAAGEARDASDTREPRKVRDAQQAEL